MRKDTPPHSPNPLRVNVEDDDDLEYIGDLQDLPDDYLGDEVSAKRLVTLHP